MKKMRLVASFTTISALSIGTSMAASPLTGYVPANVKSVCDISETTFNSAWVKVALPTKPEPLSIGPFYDKESGIVYVFPADGPNFSTAGQSFTDCAFFEWSAQMFLWLTSSVNDGAKPSSNAPLHNTGIDTPFVFSSEFFYRLSQDGSLIPQNEGSTMPSKQVRTSKTDEPLATIAQAGGDNVLFSQPDNELSESSSLVYYDILTNRPFGYIADANINSTSSPKSYTQFADSSEKICHAIKYGLVNGFVDNKGETAAALYNLFCPNDPVSITGTPVFPNSIPQLETAIDFLSMNMEIKVAWVDASTLKHPERYIIQKGSIPIYTKVEGENQMIHSWNKDADLAMVGMHVVGSVKGHPEMIWATFEHVDNAPNATYYYLDNSKKKAKHTDSGTQWLFSDGTAVSTVTPYGVSYTDPDSSVNYINPTTPNQSTPVSTVSNVNRINPWGSIQGENSAKENSAVISTSIAALTQLQAFYSSQGLNNVKDPRLNYMLTGASWGHNGEFPTGTTTHTIAGTAAMANTTMETFQQTYLQKNGDNTGCFSCHGIKSGDSKFNVSHIYNKINNVEK